MTAIGPEAAPMWVKICANTNLADARIAAELRADAVGFVFAPSKRQVTPEQVAAITRQLPPEVLRVGVFSSQDDGEIVAAVQIAGLGGVQLHSAYNPELIDKLHANLDGGLRIIQVVPVEVEISSPDAEAALCRSLQMSLGNQKLWAVLLDAAHAGASGGLGRTFAWSHVLAVLQAAVDRAKSTHEANGTAMPKLLLAGGLRPENVVEAIRTLRPEGVDVASGVEAEPGRKDPARLAAFIAAVRSEG